MKLLVVCCLLTASTATSVEDALIKDLEQWARKPDGHKLNISPKLSMNVRFTSTTGADGYVIAKDVALVDINKSLRLVGPTVFGDVHHNLKALTTKIAVSPTFNGTAAIALGGITTDINISGNLEVIYDLVINIFTDHARQHTYWTSTLGAGTRVDLTTDSTAVMPEVAAIQQAIMGELSAPKSAQRFQVSLYVNNELEHSFDNLMKAIKW